MKNFIICGTDTGVGKTYLACLLAKNYKQKGMTVGVFKPFETGVSQNKERILAKDAQALQKASQTKQTLEEICFYMLKLPASPYLAARQEKKTIDFYQTVKKIKEALPKHQINLIELAGGLLVPLTSKKTNLDLIKALKLPVILVAANKLGTINHSLLTLETLKKAKIKIETFYLNNLLRNKDKNILKTNLQQIKMFCPKLKTVEITYKKSPRFPEG